MCGRTASTRPPNVWVRATGASRYIAARQSLAPRGNQQRPTSSRPRAAASQSHALSDSPSKPAGTESDTDGAVDDRYRPSYNAGPHFFLPVLRYLNMFDSDDETKARDADTDTSTATGVQRASERKRKSVDDDSNDDSRAKCAKSESAGAAESMARGEDFTTGHRNDIAPPAVTDTLTAPTGDSGNSQSATSHIPELVLQPMRWGLIPSSTKASSLSAADSQHSYSLINARAETVDEVRNYKSLLVRHRCAVCVDLYYEWEKSEDQSGKVKKQPFAFVNTKPHAPLTHFDRSERMVTADAQPSVKDDDAAKVEIEAKEPLATLVTGSHVATHSQSATPPVPVKSEQPTDSASDIDELASKPYLLLAGLYDTWLDPSTDELIYTVTILTTSASQRLGWCHDRQPVILTDRQAHQWLRCDLYSYQQCRPFTVTPSSEGIEYYATPSIVGNIRNQSRECSMPRDEYERKQRANGITRFFKPANK